jgi:hypothetical protein
MTTSPGRRTTPAGTYELTYTLNILQPGQYRSCPRLGVLLPEVQGNSAGEVFDVAL